MINLSADTPFEIQLSFAGLLDNLEKQANANGGEASVKARALLEEAAGFPELRNGISSAAQLEQHEALIHRLLADYFPVGLTLNEIKAVSIPYRNLMFNHTQRFQNILNAAGEGFSMDFGDFGEHMIYIQTCCLILNEYYGTRFDFSKPLFYAIPTADGVIKYYRILYNADFMDIEPTERAVPLTQENIDLLLDNYDNLELWKRYFPKESWILKGFALITLYDATVENSVSILKEKLLGINAAGFRDSIESIFRSIYRIPDLRIGFTAFNEAEGQLGPDVFGQQLLSFTLLEQQQESVDRVFCKMSFRKLISNKTYFAISDTLHLQDADPGNYLACHFLAQDIRSVILAPIAKNNRLFGFLEVVSPRAKDLNSINANKLDVVMPFIIDTVERLAAELENQVQAVIQEQYTTIHNSVNWKFRKEAQQYISSMQTGQEYELKEIVFPDIHPLYGQVDIKGSSDARNNSVQKDLQQQMEVLLQLLQQLQHSGVLGSFEAEIRQVKAYLAELALPLKAGTEQYINTYLTNTVHPRLQQVTTPELLPEIDLYFMETGKDTGSFHAYRRRYDTTITMVNKKLAAVIDSRQADAQALFPHYYERFKTDGVEHNLYIGFSIAPGHVFKIEHLQQLRLWQLRVLCEMERVHEHMKSSLPYPLEVATLILVYHTTIDIRFRMDEKRFDVDGSYNARYEIVKKRIDKAFIKDTRDRITQPGYITIVYLNKEEEQEYRGYIALLQAENILEEGIEQWGVEDLQGVSGLKALRVRVAHPVVPPSHLLPAQCG